MPSGRIRYLRFARLVTYFTASIRGIFCREIVIRALDAGSSEEVLRLIFTPRFAGSGSLVLQSRLFFFEEGEGLGNGHPHGTSIAG
jgi:hypothetical protein